MPQPALLANLASAPVRNIVVTGASSGVGLAGVPRCSWSGLGLGLANPNPDPDPDPNPDPHPDPDPEPLTLTQVHALILGKAITGIPAFHAGEAFRK